MQAIVAKIQKAKGFVVLDDRKQYGYLSFLQQKYPKVEFFLTRPDLVIIATEMPKIDKSQFRFIQFLRERETEEYPPKYLDQLAKIDPEVPVLVPSYDEGEIIRLGFKKKLAERRPGRIVINGVSYDVLTLRLGIDRPMREDFIQTWGRLGTGKGEFNTPRGVAVSPWEEVYVADTNNNRIQVFDLRGKFLHQWGGVKGISKEDPGQFNFPYDLVYWKERLYVADTNNHRIQVFSVTRGPSRYSPLEVKFLQQVKGPITTPFGLAISPNDQLYVADHDQHCIHILDIDEQGLQYRMKWGIKGRREGEMTFPTSVAVGPDLKLYVADGGNHRVQIFSISEKKSQEGEKRPVSKASEGDPFTFLKQWGRFGAEPGQFNFPFSIAVDDSGLIYVVDTINRVQVFALEGIYSGSPKVKFLREWGEAGSRKGQFDNPRGIAISLRRKIYIADSKNHRIQVFQMRD
jgi:DNA-binding beta-propeller fold protein YncE